MSNNYFRFKQFTINQDRCAMKVSTDACIQGACAKVPANAKRVLDIGAGTGLLSLMLAQRFPEILIDAVEADAAAFEQAKENVAASPFADRIRLIHADARAFDPADKYDFMICNPPFFSNSLKGPVETRNKARHDETLSQEDLISLMQRTLKKEATACFLWPVTEYGSWKDLLIREGFQLHHNLYTRDRVHTKRTRSISTCSMNTEGETYPDAELIIKKDDGSYTDAFTTLLSPFYLYL